MVRGLWVSVILAMAIPIAEAGPIEVDFISFGALPQATFGGSGIPNDSVAISQFTDGGKNVTLGLTITQRYSNPAVVNNSNGTFYITPGANNGTPGGTTGSQYATWNVGFFAAVDNASYLAPYEGYIVQLLYDFDAAYGTDVNDHGIINLGILTSTPILNPVQGSLNMSFNFLAMSIPLVNDAPSATFDPFADGEYTFQLQLVKDSEVIGTTSVRAVAGPDAATLSAPEPASITLAGMGLIGIVAGGVARRRRAK
jgi:hypothetical protein